jgi:hypothetical protein
MLLGEIGKGERGVVRVTPSGEEIAPTNKAPAEEGPLPTGGRKIPVVVPPVRPGSKAAPVEDNGEAATVPEDERAQQTAGEETPGASENPPAPGSNVPEGEPDRNPVPEPQRNASASPFWAPTRPWDELRTRRTIGPSKRIPPVFRPSNLAL